jgi:predicted SAM-dependent methyltransferase
MKYLNLGCGSRFHPDWTNIDFTSTGESVIGHNLTQGIPLIDNTFDVVYHSHVLEHFSKSQAKSFLAECYRVLKPGGIIRIAIPDLEQIARTYLENLEQAQAGSAIAGDNHHWMVIEMIDQSVRNYSGGDMAAYLTQEAIPNQAFAIDRLGTEGKKLIAAGQQQRAKGQQVTAADRHWLKPIYRFIRYPNYRRNTILKLLLGKPDYQALEIGRFRVSGEVHQWMYDRYSLTKLLNETNFTDIVRRTATESYLPNWSSFNLDTETDGGIYKPDSLFMEATKPAA